MRLAMTRLLVGLMFLAWAVLPASAGPLATLQSDAAGLEWQPAGTGAGLTLTVSGPGGFYLREEFVPGQSPAFSVFDGAGNLRPAGVYVWELRAVYRLDEDTRRELEPARHSGDESALQKSGKLPSGRVYESGSFSIQGGRVVALDQVEPESPRAGAGVAPKGATISPKATFTEGVCAGFDCPGSPAFGDSTILMMENNTRIKFGDTSVSPFPNNDWEIEANSATSGALSYLGFNDCGTADNDGGCATDLVFAIEAGARQNALYVEGDGDVGVGTANPVLDLHIVTGNTPALRLEQDGSSGFTAQTWDLAGNETNFFVRDVTSGSTLPFRIFPGAGSSSLVVDADGEVGIGDASPDDRLAVLVGSANGGVTIESTTDGNLPQLTLIEPTRTWRFRVANNGTFTFNDGTAGTSPVQVLGAANSNLLIVGGTNTVAADADRVTVNGELFIGASQVTPDYVFEPDYALESIEEHAEYMWSRKHLPGVGGAVVSGGRHQINVSAQQFGMLEELEKAHVYIEQLHVSLKAKEMQIDELTEGLEDREGEIQSLAERLVRLEAALDVR